MLGKCSDTAMYTASGIIIKYVLLSTSYLLMFLNMENQCDLPRYQSPNLQNEIKKSLHVSDMCKMHKNIHFYLCHKVGKVYSKMALEERNHK